MGRPRRTHCFKGHPLDESNTYVTPSTGRRCCKICASERVKRIYTANLEANREKNRLHMQAWRAANAERDRKNWTELRRKKKEWLDSQKIPCKICGESDIACLDFHHRDSTKKAANVSVAVAHWSIKRLQTEIAKCDIICSNCHRKLHAAEKVA